MKKFNFVICLVLSILILTGCENFLDGADVKEQILESIEYNNAPSCTVLLRADASLGEFYPSGEKTCKIGYDFSVQFSVNTDTYVFKNLEAVSAHDPSKKLSDSVQFTVISEDDKKGVYSINVKVLSDTHDIQIRPVCEAKPKVVSVLPKLESSGCDQDTTIEIKFNKPVDKTSFGNFDMISIYADDDLSDYFETPVFSEDCKTLYIHTNKDKLMLPPDEAKSIMNVKVSYDFSDCKDQTGLAINAVDTHEYRINKNYGNQKIVDLLVQADEATGRFLSSGEKQCSVGYTVEVQFNLKKADYKFVNFEAVRSDAQTVSRADYVSFENVEKDDDNGIYKARVRVLKEANDILIRPKCLLLPKIESFSPSMAASGCEQDTEILIKFNKEMDAESFGNFDCLTISSDSGLLNNYFETPVFLSDHKTLCIVPKGRTDKSKLILQPDGTVEFMNLTVELNLTDKEKDCDGLAVTGSSAILERKYKINKTFKDISEVMLDVQQISDFGSFLSAGDKTCYVGYSIPLQFTLNSQTYKFNGLEAISAGSGNENLADYISYTATPSAGSANVYNIQLSVVRDINEKIIIKPKCILLPKVKEKEFKPDFNPNGCNQDTSIEIKFNKDMNTESFGSFDCISITSDGEDLSQYFETPIFSDSKTIEIKPLIASDDYDHFLLMPSGNEKTKMITVSVNFNNEKDTDGIALTDNVTYTYRINKDIEGELPSVSFNLTGEHGNFTPAKGEKTCEKTYTYQLSFEPESDYEFIKWEIYNTIDNSIIPNETYIKIAEPDKRQTTFEFVEELPDGVKIAVRPKIAERPQIISYSPMTSGVFKDSTIQILFDRNMEPSSIYYTLEELEEIYGHELTDAEKAELDDLDETVGGKKVYFGYKKNGEVFFKNLSIINIKTGENLNQYFNHPVFENQNKIAISVIKSTASSQGQSSTQSVTGLTSYTQILVGVDKGVSYKVDNIPVQMAGTKKWMYQISGKEDDNALKLDAQSPLILKYAEKLSDSSETLVLTEIPESLTEITDTGTGIENLSFLKNQKLNIDLHVTEETATESGPLEYFSLVYERLYNENYEQLASAQDNIIEEPVYYTAMPTSYSAQFSGLVDFPKDLKDGVYKLKIKCNDRSGNEYYPGTYYFAKDTSVPVIDEVSISNNNTTTYKLDWDYNIDVVKTEISVTKDNNEPVIYTINSSSNTYDVPDIVPGQHTYEIKLTYTDGAGHKVEKSVAKFLTGYIFEGSLNFEAENASRMTNIFFAGDNLSKYGLSLKKYWSDGTYSDNTSIAVVPTKSNYTTKTNLEWSYTEGNIYKKATLPGTYYTAVAASRTQKIEKVTYDGSHGTSATYYKFGDWPQSIKSSSVTVSSSKIYNDWYLGSDGYFYAYCKANPADTKKCDDMSDGTNITKDNWYYFKVEPIIWRRLGTSNILLAEKVLDGSIPWYNGSSTRTISGKTIYPNNYKYSTIRAFLNGKYESGDSQSTTYSNAGFYQKAFTSRARYYIDNWAVENGPASTNPYNNSKYWNSGNNQYACDNTEDKVFLLSEQELTRTDYGFVTSNNTDKTKQRYLNCTDYAKAKHVYQSQYDDYAANWCTRSACHDNGGLNFRGVGTGGQANAACHVLNTTDFGVVPAIKASPLP